ncbi:hypothetical protein, partial [Planktotalea sp.]|uniref:hypothetical protein n=1 Tax=Planktotalea sp. TaxID=2029877 RepID=UPI003297F4AD
MNLPILQFANAVRYRYQVAHLNAKAKSREIVDDAGDAVGFLDSVSVASGRLRVSGWIRGGAKVTLTMHGNRVEGTPSL